MNKGKRALGRPSYVWKSNMFLGIDWGELGQVKVSARICRHFSKYPVPYSAMNLSTSRATVSF